VHTIDETWEQLRLVCAIVTVLLVEGFKGNGEPDVAGADDVLDLELLELDQRVAYLFDHLGIGLSGGIGLFLALSTCDDHLTRAEDESSSLRLTNTDDDGGKTLGVVLGIPAIQSNLPQVKLSAQIGCGDNVLQLWAWLLLLRDWGGWHHVVCHIIRCAVGRTLGHHCARGLHVGSSSLR